ncbi:MAG: glutamate--cysteine ligase, partial [Planctomycetes bacterium]|nr:glutamate--cysteine ligase [Planctomycetota bacterium]
MPSISLFQAYGVELEYMIVDAESLSVRPIADDLLRAAAGEITSEVERGVIAWSNELALHVIELKTNGPARSLAPLPAMFQEDVAQINEILAAHGARLMPTAMHPWMNPDDELRLWPHNYNPVYETYNRIFDCRGHGWANLQSVHLNFPFADDEEFGRLHAAIRLLLPIMPALAASSPLMERRVTGMQDTRMEVYRGNSRRIPSITGAVIPEAVFTRRDYEQAIFARMYADIAPHDPHKILQHEWLNSRGAIARFDRNAIEVRVLDVQECPLADVAIGAAIAATLMALTEERWTSLAEQQAFAVEPLAELFLAAVRDAERAMIDDARYLRQFGCAGNSATAGELW